MKTYDVIVIGGGHAGCEAALAAARLGAQTALLNIRRDTVARMSCNPSIGGIAKSHIVAELDALGGEMPRNTDYTGIQFRMLNTRKGPAVRARRAQSDKNAYPARMQRIIDVQEHLELIEGLAEEILVKQDRVVGVRLQDGRKIAAKSVVMSAGTFLRDAIYIGDYRESAGRYNEPPADALSIQLEKMGLKTARLKTGTPPRLHKDSLDYQKMEKQPGDEPAPLFSRAGRKHRMFHVKHSGERPDELFHVKQWLPEDAAPGFDQIPCYLTHTTEKTHDIIGDNIGRSSLYGGLIDGTGVRYCPSIEDKIIKFPQRSSHHVFVEPEGRNNDRIYPNGTSNSLPEDVQRDMIHSIPGLERAEFIRPGYAIEYDFFDPTQLRHTLETKLIEHLYFAGQVNGTTGYEEAAGQGLVAGVNAVRKLRGEPPLVLGRQEAYIGVLIDDLVLKGTDEPYRMFTSRSENRLILREDNAVFRLRNHAAELGLVDPSELAEIDKIDRAVISERHRLDKTFHEGASLSQWLRRPNVTYRDLTGANMALPDEVREQVEIQVKYEGYIRREQEQAQKMVRLQSRRIPPDLNYDAITALRFEAREKLKKIQPESLGEAARISGVNPADISILGIWLKKSA